ncbi:MAG TPA: SURF1 family protein [Gemmatimonadaceae bacterium]|nr:SURF1 family protein [Gemmatimonadaceae bacterium]
MRSSIAFLIALIVAGLCIRLGLWQLDRLEQRRARNEVIAERMRAAPVLIGALPDDTSRLRYRRVLVSGTFDFEHQLVVTGRAREGSPGVYLLTPLRLEGGAVLVNRGWVYSPDAASADLTRWREPEDVSLEGYVEPLGVLQGTAARSGSSDRVRALDAGLIDSAIPYDVEPFYVVATSPSAAGAQGPVRLTIPALDEGPHKSYAIQWFSFAAIALVGVPILVRHEARRQRKEMEHP